MATLTTFTANTQIKSAEVNANFTGLSDGTMDTDHNSLQKFRDEVFADYVASGGIWTGDSVGVNRNASMTALVAAVDGWRNTISAVVSRTFTASKDTYVDVLRTTTTLSLVYTEVSNGAASPALASNSLRLAKIVTGATTIAAATSITQSAGDSLGNIFKPAGPATPVFMVNPYKFRVYRTSAQNSGNGAFGLISYDTESFDTGQNYDSTTNFRFTAPVAGFYQFNAAVALASNSVDALLSLFKNGSEASRGSREKSVASLSGLTVSDLLQLAAGDYVDVRCYAAVTTALDIGVPYTNYFSGFLVSAS